jgi:hypothetical protein
MYFIVIGKWFRGVGGRVPQPLLVVGKNAAKIRGEMPQLKK